MHLSRPVSLLLVFLMLCSSLVCAEELVTIAVMDLQMVAGVPENYGRMFSDRLRRELFQTGRFIVLERNDMEMILEEQSLQLSGCTSDECVVQVGKLLGVERMVTGSLGKIGNMYMIDARMICVETGRILVAEGVDCNCPIEEVATSSLGEVARLLAGIKGDQPTVQQVQASRPEVSPSGRGSISVSSTPSGADIYLDRINTGSSTPYTLTNVPAGDHIIETNRSGFYRSSRRVTVRNGETVSVDETLTPIQPHKSTGMIPITGLSIGFGVSYGGLGFIGQWHLAPNFALHGGLGYFPPPVDYPEAESAMSANLGAKLYLPLNDRLSFYLDGQYGGIGMLIEEELVSDGLNWYWETTQTNLVGVTVLGGGEVRFPISDNMAGALTGGLGLSFVTNDVNTEAPDYSPVLLQIDLGIGVYRTK